MIDGSDVVSSRERARVLNAVPLQNAVLCAECDLVSDSPHDTCLVCGSHSLFNVARIFGGNLPKERASLITEQPVEASPREIVLVFPNLIDSEGKQRAHVNSWWSRSTKMKLSRTVQC